MIPGPMPAQQQPIDPIEQAKQQVAKVLDPAAFQQHIEKLKDPAVRQQLAQLMAQQQDPPDLTAMEQGQRPQQHSIGALLNGG